MTRYKLPFDAGRTDQMWIIETIQEMLSSVIDAARTSPEVFFPIFFAGLFLIWLKWRFLGKATARAAKDNYAGWSKQATAATTPHETGVGVQDVLVMKPVKFLSLSIWTFMLFGGGGAFMALTADAEQTLKEKSAIAISAVFALLAVFIFIRSFDRIRLYSDRIERRRLFATRFSAPLSSIQSVDPLAKTILGGVTLTFSDGRRLKVPARMSGYRQMLDRLAIDNPKLRMMMTFVTRQMQEPV